MQGVGFRYFVVQAAARAGVVGTVRNLPDGSVEAIAEGGSTALADFAADLWRGPIYAQVTDVDEQEMQPAGRFTGFAIRY